MEKEGEGEILPPPLGYRHTCPREKRHSCQRFLLGGPDSTSRGPGALAALGIVGFVLLVESQKTL